ncbi:MAG: hypothetical protein M0R33_17635 [Methylomonas sp.]|uniref:phosphoketolase family protein n=1 Tax=Methylomonas sp. TaxID=418 RepID=UPI0025DCD6E6|nr:hypothetical protein [Methylomonas sp.]MCK9608269.1 hypothetical protein [Methylomonas sp.]
MSVVGHGSWSAQPTALKIREVNVVDLMKLQAQSGHPHGLSAPNFDALFTADSPTAATCARVATGRKAQSARLSTLGAFHRLRQNGMDKEAVQCDFGLQSAGKGKKASAREMTMLWQIIKAAALKIAEPSPCTECS